MTNPTPAAIEELSKRLNQARRHTPFGHLFPEDCEGIYRAVARENGCTVEDLRQAEGGRK